MRFPDYYGLLGIQPDHDPDELREAFLARWKEAEGSLRGERLFLRHLGASARRRDLLRDAFAVLSEPSLRHAYHRGAGIPSARRPLRPDRKGSGSCFREGCRRLVHRDYDDAYRFFRRAIERSPGDATYVNYAVFSLMVPDVRRDAAREHLKESMALDPGRAETMLLLAWMQRRSRASRLATKTLHRAAQLPVADMPLFLRLKQVPDLVAVSRDGFVRRMVEDAKSALRIPIRISVR